MSNLLEVMKNELKELEKANHILQYSYKKCSLIGLRDDLTNDELESFEALTSRFARLSDLIIQKILRYFDALDLEDEGTIRDRINRAEKKGIIKSADDFVKIRLLRNEISHEYKSDTIYDIYKSVLTLTPPLLECVENIFIYSSKYYKEIKD
jgi:hypothetical protein